MTKSELKQKYDWLRIEVETGLKSDEEFAKIADELGLTDEEIDLLFS